MKFFLWRKFFNWLWAFDKELFGLFEPFSKLKKSFCKHLTLIKIKINTFKLTIVMTAAQKLKMKLLLS